MHSVMGSTSTLALIAIFFSVTAQASNVWTVNCKPLSVQRSDPIVNPGGLGEHVHAISGGTAFSQNMSDPNAAVDALATTCDKFTDHSNYWCPQLYQMVNGGFKAVPFTGVNSYYENYTCDYHPSGQCDSPRNARAFPPGFRMIAGDSDRSTQDSSDETNQAILFTSGDQKNVYGIPTVLGNNFQAAVRFPSCWDGVNSDSPDHKSHVSYPSPSLGGDTTGGMCPPTHPYALISIGSEFGFDITGITSPSSLVFSNGDTTGFGFHGDFLQGWVNSTALQNSFANCFDNDNCPWRAFGAPGGVEVDPTTRAPQETAMSILSEDVGLTDVIAALPGDNPIYIAGGGSVSSVVSSASSPTTLATLTVKPTSVVVDEALSSSSVSVLTVTVTATVTESAVLTKGTCPPGCVQAPLG